VIFFSLVALAVIVAVLAGAAMSLFVRRRGASNGPGPGWIRTDEVFRDPGTDRMMRVWADAGGGRRHLPEASGGVSPA
jgi:hypothetical protein